MTDSIKQFENSLSPEGTKFIMRCLTSDNIIHCENRTTNDVTFSTVDGFVFSLEEVFLFGKYKSLIYPGDFKIKINFAGVRPYILIQGTDDFEIFKERILSEIDDEYYIVTNFQIQLKLRTCGPYDPCLRTCGPYDPCLVGGLKSYNNLGGL